MVLNFQIKQKKKKMGFFVLPSVVICEILSYLNLRSLGRVQRVCRRLRELGRRDACWIPKLRSLESNTRCFVLDEVNLGEEKGGYYSLVKTYFGVDKKDDISVTDCVLLLLFGNQGRVVELMDKTLPLYKEFETVPNVGRVEATYFKAKKK